MSVLLSMTAGCYFAQRSAVREGMVNAGGMVWCGMVIHEGFSLSRLRLRMWW